MSKNLSLLTQSTASFTQQPTQTVQLPTQTLVSQTQSSSSKRTIQSKIKSNLPTSSEFVGHTIQPLPSHLCRFYSQNVNGFSIPSHDDYGGDFHNFCHQTKEISAHVTCIQEFNLDVSQHKIKRNLITTAKRTAPESKLYLSQTPLPSTLGSYKPGGTSVLVQGSLSPRIESHRLDSWGRWTSVILRGKSGHKLAVYSIYQVIHSSWQSCAGTNTISAQHYALIKQLYNDPSITPRKKFQEDLHQELTYVTSHITPHVLLMGDFNDSPESTFIRNLMDTFDLHNLFSVAHPSIPFPSTYSRGQRCLDHALGSNIFVQALIHCGYEPFSLRYPSDHRAIFVDFSSTILFQATLLDPPIFQHRRLRSTHKSQVCQYIQTKHKMLSDHNIFKRIQFLQDPGNHDELAEKIDSIVTQASLSAESKLPFIPGYFWSVTLIKARSKVAILKSYLSHFHTGSPSLPLITKKYTEIFDSNTSPPKSLQESVSTLKTAQLSLREIIREHKQVRHQELEDKIRKLEAIGDRKSKKTATILRNIRKSEEIKTLFRKLKLLLKPKSFSTITQVQVPEDPTQDPNQCTKWKILDDPQAIQSALSARNHHHFHQAHGSPFTRSPLAQDIGYTGTKLPRSSQILDGTYDSTTLPFHTRLLLNQLSSIHQKSSKYPPTPIVISLKAFKNKLRKWSERTATSPSGLHLGHYKALITPLRDLADDFTVDKQTLRQVESQQEDILSVHLALLNYSLTTGYSFRRWKTVASKMIQKDPTDSRIHRHRVIHLFEADYNLAIGIQWRTAMHRAEQLELLNVGQYGSRPQRNAHDPVFIEIFQRQLSKAARSSLIQLNFDASSCYDRIIPSLSGLTAQAIGIPPPTVLCNNSTLKTMKYHLTHGSHLTKEFYRHSKSFPIYGTGQGSANSPYVWCFISSLLFDCYDKFSHGATYKSPDQSTEIKLNMTAFVDDSNAQITHQPSQHDSDIFTLLQDADHDAQLWKELLETSGGALEPSKCSYHVLDWDFRPDGTPFLLQSPNSPNTDTTSHLFPLLSKFKFLSPQQVHKTLGTLQSPTGKPKMQLQALHGKITHFKSILQRSHLSRKEALTFYYAVFLPSMTYSFPTTFFSANQLRKLQRTISPQLISQLGFNRNTPRPILYAPRQMGGFAMKDFYLAQGIHQILTILKYWRRQCQIGKLLLISMSWAQYALGTEQFFLQDVHTPLPHLECEWFSSVRSFLHSISCNLLTSAPLAYPSPRHNDNFIMDIIIQSGMFSPKQIKYCNYCRLYLNVLHISDLTKPNGVDTYSLDHLKNKLTGRVDRRLFIKQKNPPPRVWSVWNQATTLWEKKGKLIHPLGSWKASPERLSYAYPAYCNDIFLYIRKSHQANSPYAVHARSHGRYFSSHVLFLFQEKQIPSDSIPVTFTQYRSGYVVQEDYSPPTPTQILPAYPEVPSTIKENEQLSEKLRSSSTFYLVSDGSSTSTKSTFGWVFAGKESGVLTTGQGIVPNTTLSSFRSEGWGMISGLRYISSLIQDQRLPLQQGQLIIACDNEALITIVQQIALALSHPTTFSDSPTHSTQSIMFAQYYTRKLSMDPLRSDWDVLHEIASHSEILCASTIIHVKGHQDTKQNKKPLSYVETLNVQADLLASKAHDFVYPKNTTPLLTTSLHLMTSEGPIQSKWTSKLRHRWASETFRQYLSKKFEWSQATFQDIDWKALSSAISKSHLDPIQIVKIANDQSPTNFRLHRAGLSSSPLCPLCQSAVETRDHLLQCQSILVIEWRNSLIKALKSFLQTTDHDVDFSDAVRIGVLKTIGETIGNEDYVSPSPDCQDAWNKQANIGWPQIWNGKLTRQWNTLVLSHSPAGSKYEKNWSSKFITFLWKHWKTLWTLRNNTIHGKDFSESQFILRQRLLAEIQCFINQRHLTSPDIRTIIPHTLSEIETKSNSALYNWLSVYRTLLTENLASFSTQCRRGMRAITTYFNPISQRSNSLYYQDANAPPWEREGATPPPPPLPSNADPDHATPDPTSNSPIQISRSNSSLNSLAGSSSGEAYQSYLS